MKALASLQLGSRGSGGWAGQGPGQKAAGLQARSVRGGGQGGSGPQPQRGESPRGAERKNEGADPAPPQRPSTSTWAYGLRQEPAQPHCLLATQKRAGGTLSQSEGQVLTAWPQLAVCRCEVWQEGNSTGQECVCWWRGHPSGRLASVLGPEEPGGGTHLA